MYKTHLIAHCDHGASTQLIDVSKINTFFFKIKHTILKQTYLIYITRLKFSKRYYLSQNYKKFVYFSTIIHILDISLNKS